MENVSLIVFDELVTIIGNTYLAAYLHIDNDLLEQVCNFLAALDEVIQHLSDAKRPTLHRLVPLHQYPINLCEILSEDHNGVQHL